jgi:hypothetical protein
MSIKINPVTHTKGDKNRYCGPSALSAVTKMNTGEAARLLRHVSGRTSIKGCYTYHLLSALKLCSVSSTRIRLEGKRPTLAGWLKATVKQRTSDRVFLVVAGHHFQLIQGRRYVCGITGEVVSIKDPKVKRRARVSEVLELTADAKIIIPDAARKPKRDTSDRAMRREAKKLAKLWGFWVDYDRQFNYWYVAMSDEAETLAHRIGDALRDEHYCYSWGEIRSRMDAMIEFMQTHYPQKQAA